VVKLEKFPSGRNHMPKTSKRLLKVFLCYAREDLKSVRKIHSKLKSYGIDVWFDKETMLGGQNYDLAITQAIHDADVVLVCLSKSSVNADGYVNKEIRAALDIAQEKPEGKIFVIPLRLDNCIPSFEYLKKLHWVDFYEEGGEEALLKALQERAKTIKTKLPSKTPDLSIESSLAEKQILQKEKNSSQKSRIKLEIKVAIIGAVAVILAAIISALPWRDLLPAIYNSPIPTNTISALPTLTFTPAFPTETNTPIFTPTFTLTPTPLSSEFIDAKGIAMRLILAGEFWMGEGAEKHKVYLDNYYMDIYEVTNAAYKVCVESKICELPREVKFYNSEKYANDPVVYVNWNMARAYCDWRGAHVPTEAEWEKSARGTDGRIYPWGDDIDCTKANYFDGSQFCYKDTRPVGSYIWTSPYGMYDMAGNVWEWVSSLYLPYPYNPNDGREDLSQEGNRVMRGGAWGNKEDILQSYVRHKEDPMYDSDIVGFRCARTP
jgi:formylglycine-generating enzyme required for sulfatase activity